MWTYNNELYHYGVPGMKWGVRRRTESVDSSSARKIRKKKINEMSNQELRDVNNRLQLESQYKQLTKSKGSAKKFVSSFVKTAGTITAVAAAAKTYKKFGNEVLDKIGDWVVKDIKF